MEPSAEMIIIGGQEMVLIEGVYIPICNVRGERLVLIEGKYVSLDSLIKARLSNKEKNKQLRRN